jgi:hypothetical protein
LLGRRAETGIGGKKLESMAATREEELLLQRLTRTKTLSGFLRRQRHERFDVAFQDELAGWYRGTGQLIRTEMDRRFSPRA